MPLSLALSITLRSCALGMDTKALTHVSAALLCATLFAYVRTFEVVSPGMKKKVKKEIVCSLTHCERILLSTVTLC